MENGPFPSLVLHCCHAPRASFVIERRSRLGRGRIDGYREVEGGAANSHKWVDEQIR